MANAAFFSHRNLFDSPIVQFQTSTQHRSNGEKKKLKWLRQLHFPIICVNQQKQSGLDRFFEGCYKPGRSKTSRLTP